MKSCTKNCGSVLNFAEVPLPKCERSCYTTSKDPNALKSCKKHCVKNFGSNCKCINDGKKHNWCKKWNKNDDPWCYTVDCGTYSKSSKKYYKNCTKDEVKKHAKEKAEADKKIR